MGFFDLFRSKRAEVPRPSQAVGADGEGTAHETGDKKSAARKSAERSEKKVTTLAKTIADKRAQSYDRYDATEALRQLGVGTPDATPEPTVGAAAVEALLHRFRYAIDPSITDQEEKEQTAAAIIAIAQANGGHALQAILANLLSFMRGPGRESLSWPLKLLKQLIPSDASERSYEQELLLLLGDHDIEYTRNVEPKLALLGALADCGGTASRDCFETFLQDVNEGVRFLCVDALATHGSNESAGALSGLLASEESVRIKNKIAETLKTRQWSVPEPLRASVAKALADTSGYRLGSLGDVQR